MRRQIASIALTALAFVTSPVLAQQAVDLKQDADPRGRVTIDSFTGSVRVTGWDRSQVAVTGQAVDAGDVRLTGSPHHIRIEVEPFHHGSHAHPSEHATAHLEVRLPAGSDVAIKGLSAKVEVSGLTGRVSVATSEGDISIHGAAQEIEADAVSGEVTIEGAKDRIRAQTVNGDLIMRGVGGDVTASTVDGRLEVVGTGFARGSFLTVSGNLRFEGDVLGDAALEFESVSGSIDLALPSALNAAFSIRTFSGTVTNQLGPPARRASRFAPGQELEFTVGSGGARVEVHTMSGDVSLRKR